MNRWRRLLVVPELWQHRHLLGMLVYRDVLLKYRGSMLGICWSFLHPLLLLVVFSLVTNSILGGRWPEAGGLHAVPLAIYCGLVVFTPFSEILTGSPRLIQGYANYVKKIVFPVQLLPLMLVSSAALHAAINLSLLLLALALFAPLHATLLLLPIVLLPALLLACGISWLLGAIGVFVRDLAHVMPIAAQLLLFLSPVFYPSQLIPARWQWLYQLNPLASIIDNLRRVVLLGQMPDWSAWAAVMALAMLAFVLGYHLFRQAQEEFADAL